MAETSVKHPGNLADPELEFLDPTPDVHKLFVAFDAQFFDGVLLSRAAVRWSKRMYVCAGICSYDRGGLCDIALSEPLLKLRPRKNLVETLLHEMIHAYLFVTGRDTDRDGHGPKFQFHMHRINKAAGVNITIYHTFHDEVRLYKTHWWRCNGPCQHWRPFFGMVRRSVNRAPGPSDFWWDDHKAKCGGTFIKVKEPEKPAKKSSKKKAMGDITKFINNKNNNGSTNISINITDVSYKTTKQSVNNNTSFKTPVTNITITANVTNKIRDINTKEIENVAMKVREIWANKDMTHNNAKPIKKKRSLNDIPPTPPKIKKIDDYFNPKRANELLKEIYGDGVDIQKANESIVIKNRNPDLVECPICSRKIKASEINTHVDECLNLTAIEDMNKKRDNTESSNKNHSVDSIECIDLTHTSYEDDTDKPGNSSSLVNLTKAEIANSFKTESIEIDEFGCEIIPEQTNESKYPTRIIEVDEFGCEIIPKQTDSAKCPAKSKKSEKSDMCGESTPVTEIAKCPCCCEIITGSMEEHLETCEVLNSSFIDDGPSTSQQEIKNTQLDDDDELINESLTVNETGTRYPCPVCLTMVEQNEMNEHLDSCLQKDH